MKRLILKGQNAVLIWLSIQSNHMTTQFPEHGQRITLQLDGMGRLGEAIASIDGKPVFVFGGLPGEKVEVEIIRERRRYIAAEVIKVIKPSPYRQQAPTSLKDQEGYKKSFRSMESAKEHLNT